LTIEYKSVAGLYVNAWAGTPTATTLAVASDVANAAVKTRA
jgi:hypothetical protein